MFLKRQIAIRTTIASEGTFRKIQKNFDSIQEEEGLQRSADQQPNEDSSVFSKNESANWRESLIIIRCEVSKTNF